MLGSEFLGGPLVSVASDASCPRTSGSPVTDSGLWITSPGGWTSILSRWGRRFVWRYPVSIEFRTGDSAPSLLKTARTWMKRERSLVTASPPPAYGFDQSPQVESGTWVFPLLVDTSAWPP